MHFWLIRFEERVEWFDKENFVLRILKVTMAVERVERGV